MQTQIAVNPNYDPNASTHNSMYGGFGILTMALIAIIIMFKNV